MTMVEQMREKRDTLTGTPPLMQRFVRKREGFM